MARLRRQPATTQGDVDRSAAWRAVGLLGKRRLALVTAGETPRAQRLEALADRLLHHGPERAADPVWRRIGRDPDRLGPLTATEQRELAELEDLADRIRVMEAAR